MSPDFRPCDLIPWHVREEHCWSYPLVMLRAEARRRAGRALREVDERHLARWKDRLHQERLVVHYDGDTEAGFFYVPRRNGIDQDLVREPDE